MPLSRHHRSWPKGLKNKFFEDTGYNYKGPSIKTVQDAVPTNTRLLRSVKTTVDIFDLIYLEAEAIERMPS